LIGSEKGDVWRDKNRLDTNFNSSLVIYIPIKGIQIIDGKKWILPGGVRKENTGVRSQ